MRQTRRTRLGGVLAGLVLVASACGSDGEDASTEPTTGETTTTAGPTTTEGGHGDTPHFAYEGEDGPEHWGDLSSDWATCKTGTEQSPIDLSEEGATAGDLAPITFAYGTSGLHLHNNGHTVQADYDPGSTIELAGTTYELKQFHFHAQSEHTVDGAATPLEVHLVHQAEDKSLAVIGALIVEGEENPAYADIMASLPAEGDGEVTTVEGATIDAAALLPTEQDYFHYAGSLTTPGCSEGVSWQVMTEPVELSAAQIAAFTDLYSNNARPVQPLGDRELELAGS